MADAWPNCSHMGIGLALLCPIWANQFRLKFAEFGHHRAGMGQAFDRVWLTSFEIGRNSAKSGRCRPNLVKHRQTGHGCLSGRWRRIGTIVKAERISLAFHVSSIKGARPWRARSSIDYVSIPSQMGSQAPGFGAVSLSVARKAIREAPRAGGSTRDGPTPTPGWSYQGQIWPSAAQMSSKPIPTLVELNLSLAWSVQPKVDGPQLAMTPRRIRPKAAHAWPSSEVRQEIGA